MFNQSEEMFWSQQQDKNLQNFKYGSEKYSERKREVWTHLTIVMATVLGFSIGLSSIIKGETNVFLIVSWIAQIVVILLGFLLLIIDNEYTNKSQKNSFEFGYDMNEINQMDARGEFAGKEELRSGLIVSAMIKFEKALERKDTQNIWKQRAFELAEKYSSELPSSKLFKSDKDVGKFYYFKSVILRWFFAKTGLISAIFYFTIILSFTFLFISIMA